MNHCQIYINNFKMKNYKKIVLKVVMFINP